MKVMSKIESYLDVAFSNDELLKLSQDEQRRIRLINYISLISMVNMLSYVVIYCVVNPVLFRHACIFLSLSSIFTFGIILINKRGKHLLAKLLLALFTPFSMSYIAVIVFGKAPGFQVYLFVAAIIPLFLWGYEQKKYPISFVIIILLIYSIIEFFPPLFQPKIILPENYIHIFRLTNVSACFAAAGLAIATYQFLYKKKEEQLIQQAKELKISQAHKDTVYSIIAHDLRGPFGTLTGLTELFIDDYESHSEKDCLDIIKSMQHTSTALQNLLENLLDWSRMQSGSLEKSLKHLNLRNIAEETLALHKDLIVKKGHETEVNIDADLMIYADRHMVSTVFRNLVSNAIKFTSQQGKISITAKGNHNKIKVCIKDSGIGLSEHDLEKLFDIRRVDKISTRGQEKGTGLGLLLCKEFVESHEGEVWVESEPGRGSKFCFTLPKSTNQDMSA